MATTLADENWQVLLKLLPADWEQLARNTGAVTRVRGFDSVDQLLRGLLLHVGLGCSLRETVILAKAAGWLNMSDVALLKKLRQSERWLQALCVGLLHDSELALPDSPGMKMRLIDGTHVKEPGQRPAVSGECISACACRSGPAIFSGSPAARAKATAS